MLSWINPFKSNPNPNPGTTWWGRILWWFRGWFLHNFVAICFWIAILVLGVFLFRWWNHPKEEGGGGEEPKKVVTEPAPSTAPTTSPSTTPSGTSTSVGTEPKPRIKPDDSGGSSGASRTPPDERIDKILLRVEEVAATLKRMEEHPTKGDKDDPDFKAAVAELQVLKERLKKIREP